MSTADLEAYQAARPRLFGIAYRMLGSATDADDVLQDAWLRWQETDRSQVTAPTAFLARTVTNLCLDLLGSARSRRESYPGPWLPEPVADDDLGPLDTAELRDSVSMALLVLLERLSPTERAAYVLREAFGYSHREVAEVLSISEDNARQLASRARSHVEGTPRRVVEPTAWLALVTAFLSAARDGDIGSLERLLAADATSWSDGGGIVHAARQAVSGRDRVARYIAGVFAKFTEGLSPAIVEVNGELAVAAVGAKGIQSLMFVELEDGRVGGIRIQLNPDKLEFLRRGLSRNPALLRLG